MGKTRKKKVRKKLAGGGGGEERKKEGRESKLLRAVPLSPVSSRFIFLFALSQFSGPDYLGAWNRLDCEQSLIFLCKVTTRKT